MEVRGIGQGRQITLDLNKAVDSFGQANSEQFLQKFKNDSNKNTAGSDIKEKDLKNAVDKLNKFLEDNKTHAEYEVHDKLNDVMIKIVDDNTGKVIQEIPPKKILDMVAQMMEMVGVLFDKKA
ncbi:flagellar protein FlaG [Clostridium sp. SYSU_GA19001]|uniref:flagellar protein FlaG n=1 Tax=Clostridium caldaquaticum TaxID=2940653 RepID=UPI002076DD9E|nr:flagellar protein FlaG [Clostridium caldaquaticum]MCM8710958.1 flagellar protein FlaG [Clostridium caldaquaticum]